MWYHLTSIKFYAYCVLVAHLLIIGYFAPKVLIALLGAPIFPIAIFYAAKEGFRWNLLCEWDEWKDLIIFKQNPLFFISEENLDDYYDSLSYENFLKWKFHDQANLVDMYR